MSHGWFSTRDVNSIKTLVILTDGVWTENVYESERLITSLNKSGVTTILYGIDGAVSSHGSHGTTISRDINSPIEMINLVKKIVSTSMRNTVSSL